MYVVGSTFAVSQAYDVVTHLRSADLRHLKTIKRVNPASSVLQSATYGILLCESEPVMIGPAPKQAKVQTGVSEGSANAIERHSVNFSHCQNFLISSLWSEWRWSHDHGITFTMCGLIFFKNIFCKNRTVNPAQDLYIKRITMRPFPGDPPAVSLQPLRNWCFPLMCRSIVEVCGPSAIVGDGYCVWKVLQNL